MKRSFMALPFLLLSVATLAHGHTEIFFPKLFSQAELSTSGFVLLNPDPIPASTFIYFVSPTGSILASTPQTIPPGGQLAKLGSDLFPDVTSSGWVYVLNDTEGMQAFWLTYNTNMTSMDGAEAVSYDGMGPDQIIPLVAGQIELNVINPNYASVPITIRLFGSSGELAPAVTRTIATAGAFQGQVSELFPSADISQARHIRVTTTAPAIASSALIQGFLVPVESVILNGANVSSRTEMFFPHVIHGTLTGASYTTVIGVANLSSASQTITLVFTPDDGEAITVTRSIQGAGSLRETAEALFNLPATFQTGWVKVSGTAAITGVAVYSDGIAGGLAAVAPAPGQSKLFFSHIANGPPQWQTGIALLNATNAPAVVDVYAVQPAAALIGTARLTIDPGKKIAKVIDELIPQTRGVNGGFVYVISRDDVSLHGTELFYTQDLKVLSNVPAGKLVAGVPYTPPPSQE